MYSRPGSIPGVDTIERSQMLEDLTTMAQTALAEKYQDVNQVMMHDPLLFLIILACVGLVVFYFPIQAIWYRVRWTWFLLTHWMEDAVGKWRKFKHKQQLIDDMVRVVTIRSIEQKWGEPHIKMVYQKLAELFDEPELMEMYERKLVHKKLSQGAADHKKKLLREQPMAGPKGLLPSEKRGATIVHI